MNRATKVRFDKFWFLLLYGESAILIGNLKKGKVL